MDSLAAFAHNFRKEYAQPSARRTRNFRPLDMAAIQRPDLLPFVLRRRNMMEQIGRDLSVLA